MNEKLKEWIMEYDTLDKAAKALGVSKSTISLWLRGKRQISLVNCLKIEKLTIGRIKYNELRPDLIGDMYEY